MNLTKAIEASCDTFFYRAGLRIGPDGMAEWARNFGLGQRTGIDLPWETVGTVPSPAWKRAISARHPNADAGWYPGDTANMAIGQGSVQATPMQMALVAAAIGNGGSVYEPRVVVKATSSADGGVLYAMKPTISHRLQLTPDQIARIAAYAAVGVERIYLNVGAGPAEQGMISAFGREVIPAFHGSNVRGELGNPTTDGRVPSLP